MRRGKLGGCMRRIEDRDRMRRKPSRKCLQRRMMKITNWEREKKMRIQRGIKEIGRREKGRVDAHAND